jgi:hypothetical protein
MTVYIAVALVASDARRAAVEEAIALLTPSYTAALTIPVCAIGEGVTWQTPATHWYTNGASVDQGIASVWQAAALGTLPNGFEITDPEATMTAQDILDAMAGIPIWTGANVTDATGWADANLEPEGLMRVPPNNDI